LPWVGWAVTAQGLTTAGYLVLRAETAATFGALLVFTTPWAHVLKALRTFRVPLVFVVVLGMTYRYILLLLETAHAMFEARRSRTVGRLSAGVRRRLAAEGAGVLLGKALDLSGEVFLAMQARGFRGEVYVLDDFRMTSADWIALVSLTGAAVVACWTGR
jgi:energy-coupling factor transporter transmembrane protein EcfT